MMRQAKDRRGPISGAGCLFEQVEKWAIHLIHGAGHADIVWAYGKIIREKGTTRWMSRKSRSPR
jgi:hypothetical protein